MRELRLRNDINLNRYAVAGKRLVAAEIELCGFNNNTTKLMDNMKQVLNAWHASGVHDGSLPSGGVELNTHPAAGEKWHAQVTDIMRAAHSAGVWINASAGCHIHADCRDLGYLELAKAVRLIACLEPALYSIIPYLRTDNTYCHFWAMHYLKALQAAENEMTASTTERKVILTYRREILRAVYGFSGSRDINRAKAGKQHESRYRGTNIHSYLYRGTLELRMPPGTIYPQNIINWGDLVAAIIDYSTKHSMVELIQFCKPLEGPVTLKNLYGMAYRDLASDTITTSMKLLSSIAPTPVIKDWLVERQKWARSQKSESSFREKAS